MPSFLFAKNTRGENQWHEKTSKTGQIAITTTFPSENTSLGKRNLVCELFDVKWHQTKPKKRPPAMHYHIIRAKTFQGKILCKLFSTMTPVYRHICTTLSKYQVSSVNFWNSCINSRNAGWDFTTYLSCIVHTLFFLVGWHFQLLTNCVSGESCALCKNLCGLEKPDDFQLLTPHHTTTFQFPMCLVYSVPPSTKLVPSFASILIQPPIIGHLWNEVQFLTVCRGMRWRRGLVLISW